MERMDEQVSTLYDVPRYGRDLSNDGPMIGQRIRQPDGSLPYVWQSYSQVMQSAEKLAYAFRALGLPVGPDCHVSVYCRNRPEWLITEHACYAFR